ncbi:MAG: ice-binding family protein, partial [Thermoleophilia bacterium]
MKILTRLSVGVLIVVTIMFGLAVSSATATPMVNLGTAEGFAVLSGEAVTNVPNSVITGDVGLSPAAGTNYAGLTPGEVSGTIYAVDATGPAGAAGNNPGLVNGAKNDLTAAYLDAAGRIPTTTFSASDNQLGGQTLTD